MEWCYKILSFSALKFKGVQGGGLALEYKSAVYFWYVRRSKRCDPFIRSISLEGTVN
jgi:hypothetical protein